MKNKIFVAEDDLYLTRLYKRAFEISGYEVEMSSDGEETLTKLKQMPSKPDVLLLDILMPKMNGLEVLKEIKNTPELKNIPVVIFTNVTGDNEEKEAMSLGATLYLLKGQLDIKDVVAKIDDLIKK